jgi:F-type H+-transporting ATPase subunit epsilon
MNSTQGAIMATAELHDEIGTKKAGKGLGGSIQCVVVTPERTLLDETVESAVIPLYDGELGILPGHTPLIGRLGYGALRVRSGGVERRYFLDGGFAQFRDNVLTILTQRALSPGQIDPTAAEQELERARALAAGTDLQRTEKDRALARARALIRLAEHGT